MHIRQRSRSLDTDLPTFGHTQNYSRSNGLPQHGRRFLGHTYRIGLPTMTPVFLKVSAWAICALASFVLLWDASEAPEGMSQVSVQTAYATIPLAPLPTTTSSTTPVTACAEALNLALSVGWPATETPTLMRVLKRESNCTPDAFNPRDTAGGSYGYMQINGFWCTPSAYWPQGWLQAKGILTVCDELFDPKINLIAALAVWHNSNWSPWNLPK